MSVSFGGIGSVYATFKTYGEIEEGAPVKMQENKTVSQCESGDSFMGIAVSVSDDGYATVQIKGCVKAKYTGNNMAVGFVSLMAGDEGSVCADSEGTAGIQFAVIDVDEAGGAVSFIM